MIPLRLLAGALLAAAAACSGGGGGGPDAASVSFDRRALLSNLGESVLLPAVTSFADDAASLEAAVGDYCESLGGGGEEDALSAARAAWRSAMLRWQEAEMMQLGPTAMNSGELRDRIYSWPVIYSCAVDQDVQAHLEDPSCYEIAGRLTNRRGLDALEYLLFSEDLDHSCPPQSAPEGWDRLSDDEKRAARCGFAAVAAADVTASAAELREAWDPASGDYLGELTAAGTGESSISSAHEAVNLVSDAMFYIDRDLKDMKLAQPAGISMNTCNAVQEPCAEELESPFASHSRENLAANLTAFQALFGGDGGAGFDDALREVGATELADRMEAAITDAVAAAEAIPSPMAEALESDYQSVVDAHAAVKEVTDDFKSQFLTVLGLELPEGGPTDND